MEQQINLGLPNLNSHAVCITSNELVVGLVMRQEDMLCTSCSALCPSVACSGKRYWHSCGAQVGPDPQEEVSDCAEVC